MGKGSNTTTTTNNTTSAPDPYAGGVYRDILSRAQGVANTPYQAYTGELTAPVNAQQNLGVGGINANANYASPFINQAAGLATNAANPLTAGQIAQYQSPYTQQVVDATQAQFNRNNAQQQAALRGNQISSGALGGNRAGVAAANLSSQQATQQNPIIAGLYDKSYQSGLATANQQFQQNPLAASGAIANYGIAGQGAALSGAGAQLGAGTLQQQTEQQRLNAAYGQYQQAQAFPYQQAQWLAGIGTGVGSQLGGTSSGTGTSTAPPPNQTAQWLGLGLSAAGMLSDRDAKEDIERVGKMNDGTPIYRFRYKGQDQWHIGPMAQDVEKRNPDAVSRGVDGYRYVDMHEASEDSVRRAAGGGVGGVPWEDAQGWIPKVAGITSGSGAPRGGGSSPSGGGQQQPAFDPMKLAQSLQGAGRGVANYFSSPTDYGQTSNMDIGGYSMPSFGNTVGVGSYQMPTIGFARGGGVDFDDRFGASFPSRGVVPFDVMNGDPGWASPDVGPGYGPAPPPLSFNDRAAPVQEALINGDFDAQNSNSTEFRGTPGMDQANAGVVPMPRPRPDAPGASVMAAAEDPDEVLPPAAAPTSGRSRGVGVAAFAPEGQPDAYGDLPDAIRRPEERAGFGVLPISKNVGTGLLAAGLGMMASRSPFLGTAIGDGGLTGVAAYRGSEAADQKLATEAAKLSREARKDAAKFGLDVRKQDEVERSNRASEKDTVAGRAPMGMRFNAKGELEDIPGWTATLEKAAAARKGPVGELMDDDTAGFMADRIIAGDTKVLTGLGRGAQGAANIMKVQKLVAARAASGEPVSAAAREILNNAAQFEGLKTAERTQAAIMAKLSVYGRTAFNATAIAEKLSDAVDRTEWQPVNKIINAAREKSGDPKIVALGQALMTLTNEYARAIGGGHGTVHDKEAAEKRLSAAQSKEQLRAVIKVMRMEILAEEAAMPDAREHIRTIYNPKPGAVGKSIAGEHGAPVPRGPVPGASGFQPPPGAIPRTANGKTWYYDPQTKQPYPGQ